MPRSKLFYGWRMVGAAALIQFLQGGLLIQAFGAYVAVLSDERGWSKTALSAGAALQSIEGALLGPVLGWIMDRMGARTMVQAGMVIFGLGFIVLSQIDSIGGFYAAILLLALGSSLAGYFPLSVTMVHWFHRHRARALSIMGLGLALGGIAVPFVAWGMQVYGWRTTALASGIIAIALGWPLARVLRRHPSDIGERPDGIAAEADASPPGTSALPTNHFTAAQAIRTQAFWLLAIGHALALLVVTAVNVHAISHMKEGLGYSVGQASIVITIMTASQVAGVFAGIAIGDRWEKHYVAAGCMLAHMVGLLMLTYASHPLWLGGFAVLHGAAWGLRGPFMQAIRADYFGLQAIGMIMGLSAFIISIGQVAGPMVAGGLSDLTGNYRTGFTLLALIAGSGAVLFAMAKKPT